ncbi:translational GTPase TypA [Tenacibaculum maritimum]|uniref:Large ribosomal subunit assembly factor BipA n=1 Tax=Tenacibaculum maritimum NCIMB 2154 TaxID=1349785 RepID=A0A2H1EAF2_9FLAO|nr:translational GTPase TypA [Tenacibaculum maritimum]MCD9561685.1 translational GTPase TypA [Tenacibaculum maritimum]MCD9564692.1 translational GTPase TypA [Tenacibaculum maritimum]MCD9577821.1 translational GTPase TypA [Tenacibaculum maritimum]MCD9597590.1 translational GTPase TypA [Tenacibaculum maritimum]MCD9612343.1 translational GTPase TypA [Tenacibaculum maritimum]
MQSIRNIAIIAHVDHGKTTLVDKIIDQAKILDDRKERTDLLLDNNDLERERGITILSKNVSVNYKDVKINVIDTPGHADFGGEVERVLKMADGVLLLVDAFEGPMPQTRFVLGKAIELGLTPIVVVNKVDKENCTPDLVHEKVFDLMFALEATEEQLDFTTIYGSAKNGWMSTDWQEPKEDIVDLLDAVIETIPEAPYREGTPQMQITSLDFSSFTGRIAIGRVFRGDLEENKDYMLCKADGTTKKVRIKELHVFEGMGKAKVAKVRSGDICAITGIEGFEIGDTIADLENPEALPRIEVDQPTMSMLFTINNSPFFGKEGKFVTSRHLRDRLFKEMEKNLALRVDETDTEDKFNVFGRGVLHLSVLIETMRREGYELQVGRPQVIIKEIDGKKHEPMETLSIDVPEEVASKAINLVSLRKGDLLVMEPKGDLQHLEFTIPSRGLIGLRNKILTATGGQAIINHRFSEYGPYKGDFTEDLKGAIVSSETGKATAYAIDRLQDRGRFFIDPNQEIYKGQVVGENSKQDDMAVNLIKGKKLTNVRASGSDDGVKIAPKIDFSLEECMEYIRGDEYLEVTPESLRMRKINFR